MAGDAHYASVSLLLHGDGANGSTTFTDNSPTPKTVTAYGNAQISTAQSKFGGASMKFDGTGDYITVPDSAYWDFPGDFTLECLVYFSSVATDMTVVDGYAAGVTGSWQLYFNSAKKLMWYGGTTTQTGATVLSASTWYHVAVSRSGTTTKLFLDGAQEAVSTTDTASYVCAQALCAGRQNSTATIYFNGYIDDLRITKGAARYTANFTPPAAAFPNYAGEVSGVIYDDTGAPCARTVRIVNRSTGAVISSATSDAGTGAYLLAAPTLDEVQRIVLDDSGGTLYNDIIDRVIPA